MDKPVFRIISWSIWSWAIHVTIGRSGESDGQGYFCIETRMLWALPCACVSNGQNRDNMSSKSMVPCDLQKLMMVLWVLSEHYGDEQCLSYLTSSKLAIL